MAHLALTLFFMLPWCYHTNLTANKWAISYLRLITEENGTKKFQRLFFYCISSSFCILSMICHSENYCKICRELRSLVNYCDERKSLIFQNLCSWTLQDIGLLQLHSSYFFFRINSSKPSISLMNYSMI